jgi:uncharacterized membrane protein YccF (DUF307 family)
MLIYGCEDGFTGYNRLVPLFAFAYPDRIPLIDVREATRPARVIAVWTSAVVALAACVGWFALEERFAYRRPLAVVAVTLIFLLSSMSWARPRPQRVVYTNQCRAQRVAPALLIAEWFLTFASAWLMMRLDLAPVSALAIVRFFVAVADLVLIPLALLPFANTLWFLVSHRKRAPVLRLKE